MITLRTTADQALLLNEDDISSVCFCRGSIGAYPCYSLVIMRCGTRYEVRDPVEQIGDMIEKAQEASNGTDAV